MLTSSLLMIAGFALLYVGAEALIRGGAALALRLGLTPLVVGLTVVAFGTSSPELVVSIKAGLSGNGSLAVGNVVGSNICNVALILGLSAIIRPMKVDAQLIRLDVPIVIGCSLLLSLLLMDQDLSRLEGLILATGIVLYVAFSLRMARRANQKIQQEFAEGIPRPGGNILRDLLLVAVGLGLLVVGADLFVDNAVQVARALGVSDAVIGLTIVAIGTSLPELATSIVAAFKKEGDIAIGNVVGSNIFNILSILGLTALLHPLHSDGIGMVDLLVMIGLVVVLLPLMRTGLRINRMEGAFLLAIYAGYMYYLAA